ncbi:unnamed protein product [Pylaiella littoralis]
MRLFSSKVKLYALTKTHRALSSVGKNKGRFDITHRSSVVRSSSHQDETSSNSRAWKLSGAFTRFDRSFEVFEVSKAGGLLRTSVTLADVLRDFGVHARDVLSLGLQQDERYHPPPAVLPREGVVVVALGPFKALLHTDACLLFEAGKLDVSHIAPMLADLVKANNEGAAAAALDTTRITRDSSALSPPPSPPLSRRMDGEGGAAATKGREREEEGGAAPAAAALAFAAAAAAGDGTKKATTAVAAASKTVVGRERQGTRGGGSQPAAEEYFPAAAGGGTVATKIEKYVEGAFRFGSGGHADERTGQEKGEQEEEEEEEEEEEDDAQQYQIKVMFKEQLPMPFELAMLEAMLEEVCTSYHRRAHVVRRLMEQGLQPSETTSFFAPSRIEHYRVVPLKLALKQLELKLSQASSESLETCLEELMRSDEDMLGLLLTETKELGQGEILDSNRHSVVELMLENYHRKLVLVGHDVAAMMQEMESLQELSAISLDVSRNSMIAVDVRLAMLNLGVATSACIFGAVGMNTINGMESSHVAFYCLLGGSATVSAMALGGVMRHLRSVVRAGDSQQGKLMALNTICDHVDDVETVLRTELESGPKASSGSSGGGSGGGGVIKRDAMARKLSSARGKEISDEELDLIFAVFDTTGDGSIDTREYGKLVSEPAGLLGNKGTAGAEAVAAKSDLPRR